MKAQLFFAFLTAIFIVGGTEQMVAQQKNPIAINQFPPSESVGWNSPASLCQISIGSAPSKIDYASGSVSFAPGASGTIGLFCPITGVANGLSPSDMNYIALTFSNPNVEAGCTVSTYFVDRTTTQNDGWASDRSREYNGLWTANIPLDRTSFLPLNHTHEANVYLFRPESAGDTCNPVAYGMFLENVHVIF